MSHPPLPIAVLISGTGSNLKALIDARQSGRVELDFRLVISNRSDAPGLAHARKASIPISIISVKEAGSRPLQELEIARCLEACGAELIVLVGYMQILSENLVARFDGRMINLHPSLLPLYPGLNTYQQVLSTQDQQHGSSIHFVTAQLDGGPVIAQVEIPVLEGDTSKTLANRLGPNEHRLLLATIELFTQRRVKMHSESVLLDGKPLQRPLLLQADNTFEQTF